MVQSTERWKEQASAARTCTSMATFLSAVGQIAHSPIQFPDQRGGRSSSPPAQRRRRYGVATPVAKDEKQVRNAHAKARSNQRARHSGQVLRALISMRVSRGTKTTYDDAGRRKQASAKHKQGKASTDAPWKPGIRGRRSDGIYRSRTPDSPPPLRNSREKLYVYCSPLLTSAPLMSGLSVIRFGRAKF
jgi:hypothetical protein